MRLLNFLCFLVARLKTGNTRAAFGVVLGFAPGDAFAPAFEGFGVLNLPHKLDGLVFGEAKLVFDGGKGRAVFPSHHDESIEVFCWVIVGVRFHSRQLS